VTQYPTPAHREKTGTLGQSLITKVARGVRLALLGWLLGGCQTTKVSERSLRRQGQFERKTAFYVRLGNGTREITDPVERQKYIASRWSAPAA
jgi:hypothetical protein